MDADSNVQTTLLIAPNGRTVPGMPNELCSSVSVVRVKEGLQYVHLDIRNQYDGSVVLQYDVRNVPPKIYTKRHVEMKRVV